MLYSQKVYCPEENGSQTSATCLCLKQVMQKPIIHEGNHGPREEAVGHGEAPGSGALRSMMSLLSGRPPPQGVWVFP